MCLEVLEIQIHPRQQPGFLTDPVDRQYLPQVQLVQPQ